MRALAAIVLVVALAPGCERATPGEGAGSTGAPGTNAPSVRGVATIAANVTPAGEPRISILFIGNSLTYANDLPGVLGALIDAGGAGPARIDSFVYPNFGLEDHWRRDEARESIERTGWDVVVLQQGPSATEGRPSLLDYSLRFDDIIRAYGGRTALYQVWPEKRREYDFDGVCASYRMAAERTGGILLPVGEAWRIVWKRAPDLELYSRDGFHPSAKATYLAACVMYCGLTGQSPVGLPRKIRTASGRTISLSGSDAALLQEAAAEANERFGVK